MKWSWKSFSIQLVATFVAAFAIAYIVSQIIDARRDPGAGNSTLASMVIGGFLTSLLLAAYSGWRRWNFKMLLTITFIVSGLYSGNPGIAIMVIPFAALIYFAVAKLRDLISYFLTPVPMISEDSESE